MDAPDAPKVSRASQSPSSDVVFGVGDSLITLAFMTVWVTVWTTVTSMFLFLTVLSGSSGASIGMAAFLVPFLMGGYAGGLNAAAKVGVHRALARTVDIQDDVDGFMARVRPLRGFLPLAVLSFVLGAIPLVGYPAAAILGFPGAPSVWGAVYTSVLVVASYVASRPFVRLYQSLLADWQPVEVEVRQGMVRWHHETEGILDLSSVQVKRRSYETRGSRASEDAQRICTLVLEGPDQEVVLPWIEQSSWNGLTRRLAAARFPEPVRVPESPPELGALRGEVAESG